MRLRKSIPYPVQEPFLTRFYPGSPDSVNMEVKI